MRESSSSGTLAQGAAQPRPGQDRSPGAEPGRGAAEGPDQDGADMVSSQPERPQVLCRASPRGCRGGRQRTGDNTFPFGVEKPGAKPAGAPRTPSRSADSLAVSAETRGSLVARSSLAGRQCVVSPSELLKRHLFLLERNGTAFLSGVCLAVQFFSELEASQSSGRF